MRAMERWEETTMHAADSLAELIFLNTPDAASMQITLPSVETSRDLFFLMLDLFIRGMLLLFAGPRESDGQEGIAVHDITPRQFDTLAAKMRVAGIVCSRSCVLDPSSVDRASTNIGRLMRAPPDLPLDSYRVEARTRGLVHTMWFSVAHNVPRSDLTCAGHLHTR